MNEQDIIKRIENETKDLPIPESISPSNMEKMLKEHMGSSNVSHGSTRTAPNGSVPADASVTNDPHKNTTDITHKITGTGSSINAIQRKHIGLALAACFGVIIIGSGAFGIIKHKKMNDTDEYSATIAESAYDGDETYDESGDDAAYEDYPSPDSEGITTTSEDELLASKKMSDEELEEKENEQLEKDLVASGVLSKPDSYDDYYDTVYYAYQKALKKYKDLQANDYGMYEEESIADEGFAANEAEPLTEEAADDYAFSDEAEAPIDPALPEADLSSDSAMDYSADENVKQDDYQTSSSKESSGSAGKDYSTTNTQEKMVDEGDIVKTDGEYIYTSNPRDYYYNTYGTDDYPAISITKAVNGKLTHISTITLTAPETYENIDYRFQEFYIYNNYLIVLYQKSTEKYDDVYDSYDDDYDVNYFYDYYYRNNYYDSRYFTNQSCIEIYDISDKTKPQKVKTLYQSGSYTSSRISNGYLYTISSYVPELPTFRNNKKGRKNYYSYVPYINDDKIDYKDIYYSRHLDSMGTYVITSLDLSSPDRFTSSKAVSSEGSKVYVGEKSIYLYGTIYDDIEKTEIMRIGYSNGKLYIGNRAIVAGYLYGSFALSEYDKHLRIVSTIPANNFSWYDRGVWTDTSVTGFNYTLNENINAVYVLDENMHMTGKITGIAPGEQIYSARFFGDIGYFVTYRNTDPLFSVDFSDPKRPKILGQLKIPGFSNYLHFYGTDTLLGIGEEIDPYTQNFKGLKLSMFDISDPSNVTEEDKLILKDAFYSSAQYNHKSIMINPDKNVFGFCYEAEDYDYTYNYYYSTYTYDAEKGFVETARYVVDYDYMFDLEDTRGLYIGDYFYLVTPAAIESFKLGSEKMIDIIYLDEI